MESAAQLPTNEDPLAGTPYRAIRILGEGGMGVVWRAEDRVSGRRVAVKVLHDRLVRDAESLERFRTEAEVAGLLDDGNVVRVSELRLPPDVVFPYFVMEELCGETILARLYRTGAFPVDEAVDVAIQALDGLAAVHAAGVVHRDIKPGNIFLSHESGETVVKLIDFGIAKLLPPGERAPQLTPHTFETRDGTFLGTALYASPEQARGLAIDRRTDVYAMGNVLYNMLTARSPFPEVKGTRALLDAQVSKMPEPPSALARSPIPPELDELIMVALAKRVEDRLASAEAFAEALREIAAKLTAPAGWLQTHVFDPEEAASLVRPIAHQAPAHKVRKRRVARSGKARRTRRRRRAIATVALVAVLVGCAVALVMILLARVA